MLTQEFQTPYAPDPAEANLSATQVQPWTLPQQWDDVALVSGFGYLRGVYSRHLDGAFEVTASEAFTLAGAGLGGAAFLAGAVMCAAACGECGPASTYGPWTRSAMLRGLGVTGDSIDCS